MRKSAGFWVILLLLVLIVVIAAFALLDSNQDKNFCSAESRLGDVCTKEYHPVCGWNNQSIQCIKYPCASTYSNQCEACHNPSVEYWTEGGCPE